MKEKRHFFLQWGVLASIVTSYGQERAKGREECCADVGRVFIEMKALSRCELVFLKGQFLVSFAKTDLVVSAQMHSVGLQKQRGPITVTGGTEGCYAYRQL